MSIRLLILSTALPAFVLCGQTPLQPASVMAFQDKPDRTSAARLEALKRAQVWMPTEVGTKNIKAGPAEPKGFTFPATVPCTYVDKKLSGNSPKFACDLGGGDVVKVKIGGTNGEVYGEVAATRLLWALGFGADRMYPVKVICKGCPEELGGIERRNGESIFDPAVIERKMPGAEFPEDAGWSWEELDKGDSRQAAPLAHRDALKLLAVFLQHTDTKPEQQKLLCLGEEEGEGLPRCARPLMMISDLGLTFGRASTFNKNSKSGVNLAEWVATPVWKEGTTCTGNLPKSFTGTLDNPVISEAGRKFLADLLAQLSDRQVHDLFEVSRFHLRLREPGQGASGFSGVDEWVSAFKHKRDEIATRRCA